MLHWLAHCFYWMIANAMPVLRDSLTLLFAGVAAVGTVAAASSAVYFARRDRRDRLERERRRQASEVTVWLPSWRPPAIIVDVGTGPIRRPIAISNNSGSSIYEVGVGYGIAYGAGPTYVTGTHANRFVLQVPPGDWVVDGPPVESGGGHSQTAATVAFRDASGVSWIRGADGRLQQLAMPPIVALQVEEPYGDWAVLKRLAP